MVARAYTVAFEGVDARPVEVQCALAPGMRADLVVLEAATKRLCATFAGGRVSYLSGDLAERLM